MSNVRRLDLGHWGLPAAASGFYPEDLPADWQLAFYGNEFRALADEQTLLTPEAVQAETHADFRLYRPTPPAPEWQCLDARLGGVFGPPEHPLRVLTAHAPLPVLPPQALLRLPGAWAPSELRLLLEQAAQQAASGCFFEDLASLRTAITLAGLLGIAC